MNVDFQEQCSFYPSSSHVKTKTNRLRSADERSAAHRSGETSADVGSAGSPPKLQVGSSTQRVMHGQCVGYKAFHSPASAAKWWLETLKSLSHGWCLCLFWRTLTALVNEDSDKFLLKCDSISTRLDLSSESLGVAAENPAMQTINVSHWHYWFCRDRWLDKRRVLPEWGLAHLCQRPLCSDLTAILQVYRFACHTVRDEPN